MNKVYTLDDNGEFMADLKAMHEEMLLMKRRLECDEITPDEWRQWLAGYRARLEEAKKAVSGMHDELSRRNADLERQKRERASELNMTFEEYEKYLKTLIIKELNDVINSLAILYSQKKVVNLQYDRKR